jgi:hypothetical protein
MSLLELLGCAIDPNGMKTLSSYRVGDIVETVVPLPNNQPPITAGTKFMILDFPPCTSLTGTSHDSFVFGRTRDGDPVRAFIEEIK